MARVTFLYRSVREMAFLKARLLYRYNKTDYVFEAKTEIEVDKEFWSRHRKSNSRDIDIRNKQSDINSQTNALDRFIIKQFNNTKTELINKEWFTNRVFEFYNPIQKENSKIPTDLINFIEFYYERRKDEVTSATLTKYNVIKHKMMRFQLERKKVILIKDINESFKREFWEYYKDNDYNQNTTSRELDIIKTFCYYARTLGLETHSQLDTIKIKKRDVEKIFLSTEELNLIDKIDDKELSPRLQNARDWLVISCELGQRISDFLRFEKSLIKEHIGVNGKKIRLIEFTQKKTKKQVAVAIASPLLIKYLNKRKGEFPKKISDQRYNEYIKEVCKIAGIDQKMYGKKQLNLSKKKENKKIRAVYGLYPKYELITSHIGRRSFATNYYNKMPTGILKDITGHSTEKAFLHYIGKSKKDSAIEFANYFNN